MDPGEGPGRHHPDPEKPGAHGGVLPARAFTIVLVPHDDRTAGPVLVIFSQLVNRHSLLAGEDVGPSARLFGEGVYRPLKQVARDICQMPPVAQPGAAWGDVVRGGLAVSLDEHGKVLVRPAVPGGKGLKELEAFRSGRDPDGDVAPVLGRRHIGLPRLHQAVWRKGGRRRGGQEEGFTVRALKGVGFRIKPRVHAEGECCGHGG